MLLFLLLERVLGASGGRWPVDLLAEAAKLTGGVVNGVEVAPFPLLRRAERLGVELLEINVTEGGNT